METPVALNMEDWSLGGHYLTQVYEEQDGTLEGTTAFLDGLKAGTEDLKSNARWNSLMDTFDVLMKYNMNAGDLWQQITTTTQFPWLKEISHSGSTETGHGRKCQILQ